LNFFCRNLWGKLTWLKFQNGGNFAHINLKTYYDF